MLRSRLRAESFLAATGATVRHGGNRAFYSPASDHVQMPPIEAFRDPESYYVTRAHETTHNAAARIMPRRPEFPQDTRPDRRGNAA
jgi:antirestriction protein ArdC